MFGTIRFGKILSGIGKNGGKYNIYSVGGDNLLYNRITKARDENDEKIFMKTI